MNEEGKLARKFIGPSYRDTVQVMDGGYSILRLKADNPGTYVLRCISTSLTTDTYVTILKCLHNSENKTNNDGDSSQFRVASG